MQAKLGGRVAPVTPGPITYGRGLGEKVWWWGPGVAVVASKDWLLVEEDAVRLRRLAERVPGDRDRALLRMAANVLEDLAWQLMTGRVSLGLLENIGTLESLFRGRRLPLAPLRRARSIALSRIRRRYEEAGSVEYVGLPA